jgi:ribose 5-phosphate isomerase B
MTRRRVIGEREVRRAERSGEREIDTADAVVTPSARDAAARAGIVLRSGAAGRDAAAPAVASPSSPAAGMPAPAASALRLAIGADHGGVALKDAIAARLRELGHEVTDLGTTGSAAVDYPDFAVAVANAVASGAADAGIMIDGAGIGSCMAANKVPGIRAAMCYDLTTAANAREHTHANVLTLGAGLLGTRLALEIVEKFLSTSFGGGRHKARIDKIDALDRAATGRARR